MPEGLVRSGDFRNGTPITEPHEFNTPITEPKNFGNPVPATDATFDSNPVTWTLDPAHFGNGIGPAQETPTFDPVEGAYDAPLSITILSASADAIYYTDDGSTPTTESTLFTVPIVIVVGTTIKALAVRSGYTDSAIGSADFVINPN